MQIHPSILALPIAATLIAAPARAQMDPVEAPPIGAPEAGALETRLAQIVEKQQIPGLAVALLVDGEIVAQGAVGQRCTGSPESITIDDRFHIGSCTKAMTATLAGILVEQGALSWDTTVEEGLEAIAGKIHEGYHDATLRQLLAHRAGIRTDEAYWRPLWLKYHAMPAEDVEQRLEAVRLALQTPPASKPGERFDYANVGYLVAAAMMEQATGKPWEDLMREMLFAPLEMDSAGFGPPGSAQSVEEPCGHMQRGDFYAPMPPSPFADNPAITGPAGNVHCSLADWGAFAWLHCRGAQGEQGLLLKPETFEVLHEPFPRPGGGEGEGYALGWGVTRADWAGGLLLQHAGSNTMWFGIVDVAPNRGAVVLAAANAGSPQARAACMQAGAAVRELHLDGDDEPGRDGDEQ